MKEKRKEREQRDNNCENDEKEGRKKNDQR